LTEINVVPDGSYMPRWQEDFTCRVWVKDALEKLREKGWIANVNVAHVEEEARRGAIAAVTTRVREVYQSEACL